MYHSSRRAVICQSYVKSAVSIDDGDFQPKNTSVALFGMGCFWAPSEALASIPGIVDVTVGYAGGASSFARVFNLSDAGEKRPNYDSVCAGDGSVETVRVSYDPSTCSYSDLLDHFFDNHDSNIAFKAKKSAVERAKSFNEALEERYEDATNIPTRISPLNQYASVIWTFSNDEEEAAKAAIFAQKRRCEANRATGPATVVVRVPNVPGNLGKTLDLFFFKAENYHQKFWPKARVRFGAFMALTVVQYVSTQLGRIDLAGGVQAAQLALLAFILIERSAPRIARATEATGVTSIVGSAFQREEENLFG